MLSKILAKIHTPKLRAPKARQSIKTEHHFHPPKFFNSTRGCVVAQSAPGELKNLDGRGVDFEGVKALRQNRGNKGIPLI